MVARGTSFAVMKIPFTDITTGQTELNQDRVRRPKRSATGGTDGANQALAQHGVQGGRDEEWFHAHVDQPGDCSRCVVGVQRGEKRNTQWGRFETIGTNTNKGGESEVIVLGTPTRA